MIETLKGGKYEKGNLTETVNMKTVTLPKQGSVWVKWMKQNGSSASAEIFLLYSS